MRNTALLLGLLLAVCGAAQAQWDLKDSHTTADLRGIDNVGGGVAWASGTNGTVLRTEDAGYLWQACAIPPGAEHLDFRGIQAFDANTAIVMSSGKGDLSRLYKTTDGCQTWKLVFANPDKDGFWDAVLAQVVDAPIRPSLVALVGDPVDGSFPVFYSRDQGSTWAKYTERKIFSRQGEGIFAASNSSLLRPNYTTALSVQFVTGGKAGAFLHSTQWHWIADFARWQSVEAQRLPLGGTESSGAFSIGMACDFSGFAKDCPVVVVGGDYLRPEIASGTASYSIIPNHSQKLGKFQPSAIPPHGYRSAVAYDAASKTWITVGPNGTDISTDDGRNWRALHPDPALHEAPDADRNWNALSLPYVVGPHGRIGKLNPHALAH